MKSLAAILMMFLLPLAAHAAPEPTLNNDQEKTLYTLGVAIGRNLSQFSLTPSELPFVMMGIKDQVRGAAIKTDLQVYGPKIEALATARQTAKAEKEKKGASAFLAQISKEKGAVVSKSGLVYIPIKAGTGASPKATDKVKVHYHGTLVDGKVFDSSVQRGTPIDFPLNGVIPCWTEGVQKMKIGGKAKLVCPSDIAYGDRGSPPVIPGGATLIFEVELLDIVKS